MPLLAIYFAKYSYYPTVKLFVMAVQAGTRKHSREFSGGGNTAAKYFAAIKKYGNRLFSTFPQYAIVKKQSRGSGDGFLAGFRGTDLPASTTSTLLSAGFIGAAC
jgi:hypothetical protein